MRATEHVLDFLFRLCRKDNWSGVLQRITQQPGLIARPIAMENNISTTILHQAITSKGDTSKRAEVISFILRTEPGAATIRNGYGSLPLHVISQRNTKMDSKTKERLIREMVKAYKEALIQTGGVGKRTPLHIIFTDYVSPGLTQLLVENASQACFMKDKKGYLPAHVACSRHCSPEKLRMLLHVNPQALFEKTNDGQTLLDLAKTTATSTHPNNTLIKELVIQLSKHRALGTCENHTDMVPASNNDQTLAAVVSKAKKKKNRASSRKRKVIKRESATDDEYDEVIPSVGSRSRHASKRAKLDGGDSVDLLDPGAADLLLFFSRNSAAALSTDSSDDNSAEHGMITAAV